jgi:hypothetical protein
LPQQVSQLHHRVLLLHHSPQQAQQAQQATRLAQLLLRLQQLKQVCPLTACLPAARLRPGNSCPAALQHLLTLAQCCAARHQLPIWIRQMRIELRAQATLQPVKTAQILMQ